MKYYPTIGLEIHAELKTKSKMFCSCANNPDEEKANVNICPICMGHPGTLPVLNIEAIRHVLKVGIAVDGTLADFTEWDRKNYFYPDIPKGYQISQFKYPLVSGGMLSQVEIERVHLEEDTAQSTHDTHEKSLINFNRAGVPLMELVTKPVIHDAATAVRFAKELQLLLRYLGAGDANMEKGEMRVEANISIAPIVNDADRNSYSKSNIITDTKNNIHAQATVEPATSVDFGVAKQSQTKTLRRGEEGASILESLPLGTKTEVKNLNSFRVVEKAIEYEILRQTSLLDAGEKIKQETRGWDENKQETYSQRAKESSHDYRYFPEPDIPKMKLSEMPEFSRDSLAKTIPELPWIKRDRFKNDFGMTDKEVAVFVDNPLISKYFESVISSFISDLKKVKLTVNYLLSDYLGLLKKESVIDAESRISTITAIHFAELIDLIAKDKISSRGAKDLIPLMMQNPEASALSLAEKHNLLQKSSASDLEPALDKVIANNSGVVAEYKAGKLASLQYLIGQAMKETKGSANPAVVKDLLLKKLV